MVAYGINDGTPVPAQVDSCGATQAAEVEADPLMRLDAAAPDTGGTSSTGDPAVLPHPEAEPTDRSR